ncbi:MAG: FAD:protein FMN transferase [Eubacteriales bacterium]|nr:FAD:protein FMN transferase [Eubacteriales bacterium]
MKRAINKLLAALLALCLLVPASSLAAQNKYTRYTHIFFGTFDTVITILAYAKDREEFDAAAAATEAAFQRYHKIFDQYHPYEGINNVFTLNRQAALAPVVVPEELFDLLVYCREMQPKLLGKVNVAMGSVLRLWHDAREVAKAHPDDTALPEVEALRDAAKHTDMRDVILNKADKSVFFADPRLKLDVGAVAKGYATELAARDLLQGPVSHFIINAGGNVRTGNPPLDGRRNWSVGIQDPSAAVLAPNDTDVLDMLFMHNMCSVTSGDYQRYFILDGVLYHHLISPETLFPTHFMRSVTVITEDSGLADLLSTTLFLMPHEEGAAFLEELDLPVEAVWVLNDGSVAMTEGAKKMAYSHGAAN